MKFKMGYVLDDLNVQLQLSKPVKISSLGNARQTKDKTRTFMRLCVRGLVIIKARAGLMSRPT